MNYEAIEQDLSNRIKNIYQEFVAANPLPPFDRKNSTKAERRAQSEMLDRYNDQISEAKGRLAKVLSRVRAHRVLLRDRQEAITVRDGHVGSLADLRVAIQNGARVLAFDVERGRPNESYPHGELRELGYTVYQNGVMGSFNLRSETAHRSKWIGFSFGQTERMSTDAMHRRIVDEARKADFYVGHSLNVDLHFLRFTMKERLPVKEVYDTFELSLLAEPFGRAREAANLSSVAGHHGVEANQPHCGGNDARYNMEVLLAMIEAYA